jgi:hypothetical protein
MKKPKPPSQRDDEVVLNNAIPNGCKTRIADWVGCHESYISRQCNPEDPDVKSWYHQFKRFLFAVAQEDKDAARTIFADLASDFDEWCGDAQPAEDEHEMAALVGSVGASTENLYQNYLKHKPLHLL